MPKIIYIPLENLEQRYTKMMNELLAPLCHVSLYPKEFNERTIKNGQFLDITGTCIFKSKQLTMIAEMFDNGKVNEGDVFLVADIFFPGIEMISYMAELLGIKVYIYGFNYAGRADKTDFVQKLGRWADFSEAGYHDICDGIFVGSQFHRQQVIDHFGGDIGERTRVVGYIWSRDYAMNLFKDEKGKEQTKHDRIIWPHRMSSEKGIDELLEFAKSTTMEIIITSSGKTECPIKDLPKNVTYIGGITKKMYYSYLATSKYYLSTAHQETFGYTLQEAMLFGCEILVPNRACYPEMVPAANLYNDIKEIEPKFKQGGLIVTDTKSLQQYDDNREMIMSQIYEDTGCRVSN